MRLSLARTLLGVVAATTLALGGCSSGSEPDPREPTGSPKPIPTRTAPTMPAAATENTPEGAATFVKHYVDVLNYASATGDVDELTRLSAPDCTGCQSYITLYRDTYAAGGYFKNRDWALSNMEVESGGPSTRLFAHLTVGAGESKDADRSPAAPIQAVSDELIFSANRSGDEWRLASLVRRIE